MPCQLTHMYLACRIAQEYSGAHKDNDVIQAIHKGFIAWLQANEDFKKGAEAAISKDSGSDMQKTMDTYRNTIESSDDIAVFSAFCTGGFGPDIWMLPHQSVLGTAVSGGIIGAMHFDLGHYNLSHAFPSLVLRRIRGQSKTLPELQRKYQTAYILGYISHIALDITGHVKVNVFAGAYFQQEKPWETEQSSGWTLGAEAFLKKFNDHNKIEQYFDSLVRFVLFEGYHTDLQEHDSIRTGVLNQKDHHNESGLWNFPNYSDYWSKKLKFGLFNTDGIYNSDTVFLDNSTSLGGPFGRRYTDGPADKRVTPFIHRDFCLAYDNADDAKIKKNEYSILKLSNEIPKVKFSRMDNNDSLCSQYYYSQIVIPDMDKIKKWGVGFYNPRAFADFVLAGRLVAVEFIDSALDFLTKDDVKVFDNLRNWNLDIGMAIRFKDTSDIADQSYPKKPSRPVTIDLVNVMEAVPALSSWQPPTLNVNTWRQKQEDTTWTESPEKKRIVPAGGSAASGATGTTSVISFFPQSGIDIRMSQFKLYSDSDEIASFLFGFDKEVPGKPEDDGTVKGSTDVPDETVMYKMKTCIEDFAAQDKFAKTREFTCGKAKMKEYVATFLGRLPRLAPQNADPASPVGTILTPFDGNHLPRYLRVTACRKYVCQPNDDGILFGSGNFHASKFKIYKNPFPSEEMTLAIFPLIRRNADFIDLFHYTVYAPEDVAQLKKIREKSVNVILLVFSVQDDAATTGKYLKIEEAWVDGERQPIDKVAVAPVSMVYKVEFEDLLFRTDSAVVLPENYVDRKSADPAQDRISGLDVFQVIIVQAKEYPEQKLFVTGHTDRVGKERFNFLLSKDRADSVYYILCGKKEEWKNLADKRNHADDKRHILSWVSTMYGWDCDPGAPNDTKAMGINRAIKKFQRRYNTDFIDSGKIKNAYGGGADASRIPEDSDFGPKTWGAVFDLYQDSLAELLETTFEKMNAHHSLFEGRWIEDGNKSVPCGETFPKECPELDEYECAVNRRVEVLFFDPKEVPSSALPCNSGEQLASNTAAANRTANCTANCPVYKDKPAPQHLSVTPHSRPQTSPKLFSPQAPGSAEMILLDGLNAYLVYFKDGSDDLKNIRDLRVKAGKFCDAHGKEVTVDGDRETWLYFSNRDALDLVDKVARFKKNGGELPLIGPVIFTCGENVTANVDIWAQKDWAIVRGVSLDGKRASYVAMAEQNPNYSIGYYESKTAFRIYGDTGKKDKQEKWMSANEISCARFGVVDGDPCWIGTLSVLPSEKVKILLCHQYGKQSSDCLYAGSFNNITVTGENQIFSHHTYDKAKVETLLKVSLDGNKKAAVDTLSAPPASFLLPGDTCWHDQGNENACGPYSFAAAMNYWYPYTNNPKEVHNGLWYHKTENVPSIISGARTPANILTAAEKFDMNARDNDGENVDKDGSLKLLRSWVSAGVPVMVLVKEFHELTSYHWKLVVGYEQNRFFFNNSGADLEYDTAQCTPGVDYEHAPVGNDVDSVDRHHTKWREAGADIVDLITSVDQCTLIPVYPKNIMFGGSKII